MDESDGHVLRRWISMGDVIVLVSSLLAIGVTYGSLATRVDNLQDDVAMIRQGQAGPTPGAAQALATVMAKDAAQDAELQALKQDMRDSRREVLAAIGVLSDKLDRHMDGVRK